ncbi:MAG: ferritin-like domain-containing protein [Parvibaculum sp.]|uniref:ferritin-like domain-containing protein n=1 Tax=Parvibaculum sp. TaxID=2024848 RepID=UPI0028505523|nr:ferritin-like domain-containing protein [Parvibaculum sp.]MDR3498077.1 ferritin-like domain-containing protein [Parvibaculum sp.]
MLEPKKTFGNERMTMDAAYEAVAPDDFPAMMDVDRYNNRSTAFDKIISATHDHFWDPLDPKYIDFNDKWDLDRDLLVPMDFNLELQSAVSDKLDEGQKIYLVNESVRWTMSSILHGEQGALALSASLCHILKDPGAQEYAANQTREEARHVTGFAKYIQARWGKPTACGIVLRDLLVDIVATPLAWKKLVGMQMIVEGLAMGTFAKFYSETHDPLMKKLMQFVMTDEAFHHKFGKIWADRTVPNLPEAERDMIEDWALEVFMTLLRNSTGPEQKKVIYEKVGLDWRWVQSALLEAMTDRKLRQTMMEGTSVFRVLIKTLLKAGIITKRTASSYAAYVAMEELHGEGDRMIGDDIAEQGIRALLAINGAGGQAAIYAMGNVAAAE